jgi:putative addiction module component (TIGR02574 family)
MPQTRNNTMDVEHRLNELMALPPEQRLLLGERLIESVPTFGSPEIEQAWSAEISRRVAEIEDGTEPGIPAENVFREARQRLTDAREVSPSRPRRDD